MKIIPTVGLQTNITQAEKRIEAIKKHSRWIQIDVSDGIFTEGKTFELELLRKLKYETDGILWDVHLMVKEPEKWIEKCIFIGASRIIGQVEMMEDRDRFVTRVRNAGLEAGLAFDVETEIKDIPDETDEILIMGRKAGTEKAELDEKVYEKIMLAKKFEKLIGIDGGVNMENIKKLEAAGADVLYSESSYFELINADKNQ